MAIYLSSKLNLQFQISTHKTSEFNEQMHPLFTQCTVEFLVTITKYRGLVFKAGIILGVNSNRIRTFTAIQAEQQ
jgi:hypothetical protein